MNHPELEQIKDLGAEFSSNLQHSLGGSVVMPTPPYQPTPRETLVAAMANNQPHPQMPMMNLIPIGQNLGKLVGAVGEIFGYVQRNRLHPAIVDTRTTARAVSVTYLASPEDEISPQQPTLSAMQRELLNKAVLLQNEATGNRVSDTVAPGRELGHVVLGFAALLRPQLLEGEHAVHGWAASAGGIAAAVTTEPNLLQPEAAPVYDFRINGQTWQIRERTARLTNGFLVDHPAFHHPSGLAQISAEHFTTGSALYAVASQLEIGYQQMQERILTVLEQQ